MKSMHRLMTVLVIILSVFLLSATAQAQKLRIAGNFPKDHSSSQAMEIFKTEVEKLTGGKLTVDLFPDMQLGGAQENVDQVRSGTVFATWIGVAYLSRTVPELEAVSLPFVFADREKAFKVMEGRVGALLDQKLAAKGYASLGYMELGMRNVTNSVRPIRSLADFKGLKIRLQPNETHLATFRAIGANPVSMGIQEVYSALQQRVIDGHENPYSIILTRRFDEVQKYLSDSGHFFDFIIVAANKRQFDNLKPDDKKAVQSAMSKALAWQHKQAAEEDLKARDELIKRGMQFDKISPAARTEMVKATAGVVDLLKKRIGSDVIDAVMAEVQK